MIPDATPPEQTDSGNDMFVDRDEINGVIGAWEDQGSSIRVDGIALLVAATNSFLQPPANDVITVGYFAALSDAFREFAIHNHDMLNYTTTHIEKLSASRNSMADIEDANRAAFRFKGGV